MGELLFFIAVSYLLFNGRRLGGLFGTLGSSVREFKKGLHGGEDEPRMRDVN